MEDFKVTTLSKEVQKQTKVKVSGLRTFFNQNRTLRYVLFLLIAMLVYGITAGVGFYYVSEKQKDPIPISTTLQKDDIFYFKYSYLEKDAIEPIVKYKLGKVGQNNIFDNNGSGFEESIIGMRVGERKNIVMNFPSSSKVYPGQSLTIHIKILAMVEKYDESVYYDPSKTLEEDDIAVFDFKGFHNGEAFDGGSAKYYSLLIGSKRFIEGFEDQMVGMKEGETKNLDVVFPDSYPNNPELAGEHVIFEVFIRKIVKKVDL